MNKENSSLIPIDLVVDNKDSRYLECFKPTNENCYFIYETVPEEDGRYRLIQINENGDKIDLIPKEFNIFSLVYEYGGNSITIINEAKSNDDKEFLIMFSDYSTQELYLFYPHRSENEKPKKLIYSNDDQKGLENKKRYADGTFDSTNQKVVLVCEDQNNVEKVEHYLVEINLKSNEIKKIESGYDFYSFPRFNSDGSKLAYVAWNFPNMPWNNTHLLIRDMVKNELVNVCDGGKDQSVMDPVWNLDTLYYISDLDGYWTIYKYDEISNTSKLVIPSNEINFKELADPMWYIGKSHYGFITPTKIISLITDYGILIYDTELKQVEQIIKNEYSIVKTISSSSTLSSALIIGGSSSKSFSPILIKYNQQSKQCLFKPLLNTVNPSKVIDESKLSIPKEIEFLTGNNEKCFAYYYPPSDGSNDGSTSIPPVLIKSHGGPTDRCYQVLNYEYQYWTSRGWAIIDVNYRGSSGYGKRYRNLLNSNWGKHDVEDCCSAALHAVSLGLVDKDKIHIDGGSAGGYTTLSCLVFKSDIFKAGCSYFGVADLELLFKETHKFESRYQDILIAPMVLEQDSNDPNSPLPEWRKIYRQRSPIYNLDHANCPIALFHGKLDKVVPCSQSELVYDHLKSKSIPTILEIFDNEAHGFTSKDNIIKCLELEYQFFCKLLDCEPIGIKYNKIK